MFENENRPDATVDTDERIGLMQAYVQVTNELLELHERRERLNQHNKELEERRGEIRSRLGEALGFADPAIRTSL